MVGSVEYPSCVDAARQRTNDGVEREGIGQHERQDGPLQPQSG